jgi:hypothetical protein
MTPDEILAAAEEVRAAGASASRVARDPVNQAMINNWVEALGDANPIYVDEAAARAAGHDGIVAPPAMIQVWTMYGLHGQRGGDDPLGQMMNVLDAAGFTSVVATNCEQTYRRYLQPGEQVSVTTELDSVVGPKRTGLGDGWFVTTLNTWYVGDEPVAEMLFRVLKFAPGTATPAGPDRSQTLRPLISQDTACGAEKQDWIVGSGRGTVFSYVIHHHPKVPGKQSPFVVALVELDEGVRMLGELIDVDPATVEIGMPVEIALTRIDDDLTLPFWRSRTDTQPPGDERSPEELRQSRAEGAIDSPDPPERSERRRQETKLPALEVDVSPTFVVSTALATRDFQDVHHDRDKAIARGSKDIFVNILTDTGIVQRYVTDWAGPSARVKRIAIRLGVPAYAYDTLVLSGEATEVSGNEVTVSVVARGNLGEHIIGTVEVSR